MPYLQFPQVVGSDLLGAKPSRQRNIFSRANNSLLFSTKSQTVKISAQSIKQLAHSENETPVIVVSTLDNWDSHLAVISAGAFDYVEFPPYPGELERLLHGALRESQSSKEQFHNSTPLASFGK